jgi:hypothetical protein
MCGEIENTEKLLKQEEKEMNETEIKINGIIKNIAFLKARLTMLKVKEI